MGWAARGSHSGRPEDQGMCNAGNGAYVLRSHPARTATACVSTARSGSSPRVDEAGEARSPLAGGQSFTARPSYVYEKGLGSPSM
jgi:hypothetical protein